jgi:hypothetical protein
MIGAENTVMINGEELRLKYTLGSMSKIKAILGKPFASWLQEPDSAFDADALVRVLQIGLEAGGNPKSEEYLLDNVYAYQQSDILMRLMGLIGGEKVRKQLEKAKAEEEEAESAPGEPDPLP